MILCARCLKPLVYKFALCRVECACRVWVTDEQLSRGLS